jgi:hypothetical protein
MAIHLLLAASSIALLVLHRKRAVRALLRRVTRRLASFPTQIPVQNHTDIQPGNRPNPRLVYTTYCRWIFRRGGDNIQYRSWAIGLEHILQEDVEGRIGAVALHIRVHKDGGSSIAEVEIADWMRRRSSRSSLGGLVWVKGSMVDEGVRLDNTGRTVCIHGKSFR